MTTISKLYIPLPFQNPRLLIPSGPARMAAASFLLYPPASARGKLFKKFAVAAARLGLFPLVPHRRVEDLLGFSSAPTIDPLFSPAMLTALEEAWRQFFNLDQIFVTLSLGTPDHYRKVTALIFDAVGKILGLAKIGATPQAKQLIKHEYQTLELLKHLNLNQGITPKPIASDETSTLTWLLQSALADGRVSPLKMKAHHLTFLAELASQTRRTGKLRDIPFWKSLTEGVAGMTPVAPLSSPSKGEQDFIKDLFRECQDVMAQAANDAWPLTAVHGDFAPWNIRVIGDRAAVYDWENFLPSAPAGWDALHYEVRVNHLVKKRSLADLFIKLNKTNGHNDSLTAWEMKTGIKIPNRHLLALLLFADLCCGASRKAIVAGQVSLDSFPREN